MQVPTHQIPLENLVEQILFSRKITQAEQNWLVTVLSNASLTEEQQALIQRVFYGLRHNLLQIVD